MKWEYIQLDRRKLIQEKRDSLTQALGRREADMTSDYILFQEVLKDLGDQGWELFNLSGDILGKRHK